MIITTFLSAFFISSIAAWFSIAGLIAIFPGAPIAVGLMGAALELGKLVSASWLYRSWDSANKWMKLYFIGAIFTLSFITSIGIFGYLTRAHVEGTESLNNNNEQIELINNQIEQEQTVLDDARKALQQLDASINILSNSTRTAERAIVLRNNQRKERSTLNDVIKNSNEAMIKLRAEKAQLSVGQRKLETEVGPIKYVAQMVYGDDDTATLEKSIRLLTILLIFVFDPLAILLVVASNQQMKTPPLSKIIVKENKPVKEKKPRKKDNVTNMTDWNPGSWFKMVKTPKDLDGGEYK